jgi:UDP:flavonoid glycosyltransferase YjiC (YdhE family)
MINGLGLGNSTRCHAIIQRLAAMGCRIHVLTSGNGLSYFQNRDGIDSLMEMESLFYSKSNNGISGWSTLKSLGPLARVARAKLGRLTHLLDQWNPDVAVIDSEYTISPLRRRGIPVVAINNSEVVVSEYLKRRKRAVGTRSHFWFIEFSDYLFHRCFADLVLSPFPQRTATRHPKFKRIGLIVRPEIKHLAAQRAGERVLSPRELRTVVFMLSGSIHASQVTFEGYRFPFQVDVVGRTGQSQGQVTYHGRQMNNLTYLERADAFVINGGYSAVSECFALRKPVWVLPVPGHAEQFVNASLVEDFGLGFRGNEAGVLNRLLEVHQQDRWGGLRLPLPAFEINGDEEAAEAILACAARKRKIPMGLPIPATRAV